MSERQATDSLKADLRRGLSLLERLGIVDFNGHFSARLANGNILINSGNSVRSAVKENDFVVVGADGSYDGAEARPPAELPLHLAVYAAREDVGAVLHGHPKWSTLLSSAGRAYRVTLAQGALLGEIPTFPSPRSVNDSRIATEVASLLGEGSAIMLRSHGSVVVGRDVMETAVLAIYMELNSERQVTASLLGSAYIFSDEETAACRRGLAKRGLFRKCWDYYLAKFALSEPSA